MTSEAQFPKREFQIRKFEFPEDYQAVIRLWQQAGPGVHVGRSDGPDEIAKKLRRDPDLFLIAETGGEIIGCVLGGFDGRRGLVYHLAVLPPHTRKGVGNALMEELERRLKTKGCLKSYLLVTRENAEAMYFYEARGWEPMDLLIYGKDLG
jgi:ribosomal protein S18 acetylase RimI-like enzyme